MELTSGIYKRYKRPFVLDEESLRRCQGILAKASQELPFPALIVFHVEREDDRYYETTNIDDVLTDPNIPGRRITIVGIELRKETASDLEAGRSPDAWRVAVLYSLRERDTPFPDPDMARIRIATHDKNWSLLLADQLEPQVQRTFRPKATPRWLLALFLIPFAIMAAKAAASNIMTQPKGVELSLQRIFEMAAITMLIGMLAALFFTAVSKGGSNWMARAFGPESCFLWGEEAQSYPQREQTRRQIQWGIIVAFLASLAASTAFALISK